MLLVDEILAGSLQLQARCARAHYSSNDLIELVGGTKSNMTLQSYLAQTKQFGELAANAAQDIDDYILREDSDFKRLDAFVSYLSEVLLKEERSFGIRGPEGESFARAWYWLYPSDVHAAINQRAAQLIQQLKNARERMISRRDCFELRYFVARIPEATKAIIKKEQVNARIRKIVA